MRWRYWYPQREFPYTDLTAENRRRSRLEPEYELLDTGIFDEDRYWDLTADYAKADPDDVCIRLSVRNAGPEEATLHVLPTVWFRNTWSWGRDDRRPVLSAKDGTIVTEHAELGRMVLTGDGRPTAVACENESNAERLWGPRGRRPTRRTGSATASSPAPTPWATAGPRGRSGTP